jgi:hypothetical protein
MYIRKGSLGEAPELCFLQFFLRYVWTLSLNERGTVCTVFLDCGLPIDHCLGLFIPRLLLLLVEKVTCRVAKMWAKRDGFDPRFYGVSHALFESVHVRKPEDDI